MTTHVHPDAPRPVWQGLDGLRGNHAVALQYNTRLGVPPATSRDLLALRALQIPSCSRPALRTEPEVAIACMFALLIDGLHEAGELPAVSRGQFFRQLPPHLVRVPHRGAGSARTRASVLSGLTLAFQWTCHGRWMSA